MMMRAACGRCHDGGVAPPRLQHCYSAPGHAPSRADAHLRWDPLPLSLHALPQLMHAGRLWKACRGLSLRWPTDTLPDPGPATALVMTPSRYRGRQAMAGDAGWPTTWLAVRARRSTDTHAWQMRWRPERSQEGGPSSGTAGCGSGGWLRGCESTHPRAPNMRTAVLPTAASIQPPPIVAGIGRRLTATRRGAVSSHGCHPATSRRQRALASLLSGYLRLHIHTSLLLPGPG
jgi:hypothetical protein